jgi:chorismate-pyruvate lyase
MSLGTRKTLSTLLVLLTSHATTASGAFAFSTKSSATWPNDFLGRLEALALLQTLNAQLLSNDSATLTLERWCAVHRLVAQPRIVAERVRSIDKSPTEEQLRELGASVNDPVRYRRVKLFCGTVLLSEADNWYLPERLTPKMNELLDTTDMPFGRVVQDLHFRRRTLSASLVWPPLPEGWELEAAQRPQRPLSETENSATVPLPARVLVHRALLTLPDGTPFSEVVESYTGNVLAFPSPSLPEIRVVAKRPPPTAP